MMMTSVYLFIPLIIIVNVNPQDNNTLSWNQATQWINKPPIFCELFHTLRGNARSIQEEFEDLKAFNGYITECSLCKTCAKQQGL